MAVQDVRELVPRVRRAIEGPVPAGVLSDPQVEAAAADAIADIILLTVGMWRHTLTVTERSDDEANVPVHWGVDPELSLEEESVVAAQAAISYFFHLVKGVKSSERIVNEGQTWEYSLSANVVRDQIKLLQEQRDAALNALKASTPALARYASILAVRDRVGAALLEPWTYGGGGALGGGQERGATWQQVP